MRPRRPRPETYENVGRIGIIITLVMCRILELALEMVFSPGGLNPVWQFGPNIFQEPKTVASFIIVNEESTSSRLFRQGQMFIADSQFPLLKGQEEEHILRKVLFFGGIR